MDNRIKDAFEGVRAEDELKRGTKAYLAERLRASETRGRGRALMAALACLALILLGGGGYRLYFQPVAAISVDVNPSVELGVNRFDRVVSVNGYNADGERLAGSVELIYKNYADALETLMSSEEMQAYLGGDALVSISVVGQTDAAGEEMLTRISACGYAAAPNVECRCADRDKIDSAHEAGLSFGKYQAFLELQALDPKISAEDVQGLTMRQIRDMLEALSGVESGTPHGHKNGGVK